MHRLVLAAGLLASATAISGELGGVGAHGKADGKQFDFSVTRTVVNVTPAWPPDSPCPPLEPRRAIEIATKQLHQLVKEPALWHFHQLNLIEFAEHHWTYIVMFDRDYPENVAVYGADYFEIPVLMSSATLKPKILDIATGKYERNK